MNEYEQEIEGHQWEIGGYQCKLGKSRGKSHKKGNLVYTLAVAVPPREKARAQKSNKPSPPEPKNMIYVAHIACTYHA